MSTYLIYNGTNQFGRPHNQSGMKMPSFTVGAPTFALASSQMKDGIVGVAYSDTLLVFGGTGTIARAVTTGALPTGLSLNSTSGAVTGTPTVAAAYSFTVTATDADGNIASRAFTVTITDPASSGGNFAYVS